MRFWLKHSLIALACLSPAGAATGLADDHHVSSSLAILPSEIALTGPQARQRLLAQRFEQFRFGEQLLDGVVFTSSNPQIVVIRNGIAVPKANGEATITAHSDSADTQRVAPARVRVTGMDQPQAWTFRNHVLPVLAKSGCNSGACHGALAGQGGFKLSLRGYDPVTDYHTITRQARGRRIELADPGRSLLLAKPTGAIRHKGGIRFKVDSQNYRVLADWIAGGTTPPAENDARLQRLEILPATCVLTKGASQQVVVRAHYSNGQIEDVTHWAKYAAADETVATVDDAGRVSVIGHGEGAVTAWFSSQIVMARITSPYENQVDPSVFVQAERRNFIDDLVLNKLQQLNLPPSPPATDEEFLRRVCLDMIGTLPTADEVRGFLADTSPDKRDQLIDALLSRPEAVDYWTYKWSDVLLINGQKLRPEAVKAYYHWIRQQVAANTPWDEFARLVVTATGSSVKNGATNFYALHQDPETMSENVSQAFLGLSINCAKCHNHPLEKWTNDQYYAMANMFARVRAKGWGGDPRNGDGKRTLYVSSRGDLIQPRTGKPQPPTPLDGQPIPVDAPTDRREYLADWLTSPDNPYFSRAIANRVWANFFGVGLVEAVDDLRASNPASHEQLLQAAARHLVDCNFDLQSLMRTILQSATYQRSSLPLAENKNERRFYSRYYPRRMMAEVLLDAIAQVTQVPDRFEFVVFPGADKRKTDFYPTGTRAIQLYDSAVESYFLKTFGRNPRMISCACERSDEPSMVQVLHISNGKTINDKLKAKENRVGKLLQSDLSDEQLIAEAYLVCLSRFPTNQEQQELLELLAESRDTTEKRILIEDLFWGLMSSREFLFNH